MGEELYFYFRSFRHLNEALLVEMAVCIATVIKRLRLSDLKAYKYSPIASEILHGVSNETNNMLIINPPSATAPNPS